MASSSKKKASKLRAHKAKPRAKTKPKTASPPPESPVILDDLQIRIAVIESSPDFIGIATPDGRCLYLNSAGLKQTGYAEGELGGMRIPDFQPDLTPEAAETALREGAWEGESSFRRKDGTRFPVSQVIMRLTDASGRPVALATIARDITEKRQAEQELRDSRRLLQLVLDTIPARVFWKDRALTYRGCNRRFAVDTGRSSPEEVIGQDDFGIGWRGHAEDYRADDRHVIDTGEPRLDYEEPAATPDGRRIWVRMSKIPLREESGAIIGVLGTYEDVTERRKAETALAYRLSFEQLISRLSTRFINLRSEEIDAGVCDALRDIGRFLAVDRSYVFLFHKDGQRMDNTHEWCEEGISAHVARLQGVRVADFSCAEEARRGSVAHVRVADLTPDSAIEKEELEREGIRSLVLVPMSCRGEVLGFLGLDAVREERVFDDDSIALLRLVCECLAGALDRKRYEEALRSERDTLNSVMETSPAGIVRLDPDGRILFANSRAEQVLGLTRDVISGRTYRDPEWKITDYEGRPFPDADLPFARVKATGQAVHDVRHAVLHPGGRRVLLSVNAAPLLDERGAFGGVVATVEDVTARVATDDTLRGENAFRKAIIDRAAEGLCVCHSLEAAPHIRFTVWNDRMTEITGYTMDEINQHGWYQAMYPDPDVQKRAEARMARMRDDDDLLGEEWEIARKGGGKRTIAISTTVIPVAGGGAHVLALMHDLTERKRAEESLRASEARLRSIFRASPIGIGLVRDRVLLQVNDRLCEMTGYTEQELIGQSSRMVYPTQEDFDHVGREKYAQIQRSGIGTVETRWQRKDGGIIDVLLSSVPLDPGDLSAGVTFTALDITERNRAEEEQRRLQAQVQHVQKLESLGVLAGGIAHDFNNLLMGILGNAELAVRGLSPVSPVQTYLRDIDTVSRRAADLCRQMLAYSGKGRFVIEALQINEVVEEMTRILEVSISKKAVLKFNLGAALPAMEADATQIRQVVMNLITNASEAIADRSGVISITTGAMRCDRAYLEETYLAESMAEGTYVYVEVADTGCGMAPEVKAKIFDPFFTTKFTGRGLGMAAVLGIVRGHKGGIKIYTEPGKGTTVKVLFPASEKAVAPRPGEAGAEVEWTGSGTVLLVDDDETVRVVTERMLALIGFTPLIAADGREALEIFRERHAEVSCVVLDLTMPHMDGEETYRELRRIDRGVRVIMSSGYNEQEVTQRFVGKGLAGFIQKPFQLETLRAKLRELTEGPAPPEE